VSDTPAERDRRWLLNDEREFLIRSLDDAEREHEAGDLSDADYTVLANRDCRKLAEVEAELAQLGPDLTERASADDGSGSASGEEAKPNERREWRRVGIIACCFLIVAGAVLLVSHALQSSTPGQPVTGSVSIPKDQLIEEELNQAEAFMSQNEDEPALQLFGKVLQEDPKDPEALADFGWLTWRAGETYKATDYEKLGVAALKKAIRVSPSFYKAHLYYGLVLYYQDKNYKAAAGQFTEFLADDPPTSDINLAGSDIVDAYRQAGLPVPPVMSTTTTTTTKPTESSSSTTTTIPSIP
jgi:tetratricopeptide (TPR) repeat protein